MQLRSQILSILLVSFSWSWVLAEPQATPPASASFDIAAAPSWVTTISLDPGKEETGDAEHGGISYLIVDRQDNVAASTYYYHEARRITSENGVQNGAAITVSFDPSFQKLTFHSIQLSRGGIATNRLSRSQIRLFQREKDMESFLYDGAYTAQCELEDVRVGDMIEFAYSRQGDNPVLNGRYSNLFYVDFNFPVCRLVTRVVYPAGRKLNFSIKNRPVKPVVTTRHEVTEWFCDERNVQARWTDPDVPVDYDPNGRVQISEFSSWQEIVDWALPLYETDPSLSADLQTEISKLCEIPKAEERILAALRFVQDQVRYLGIESGIGSHRPTAPSEVLRRRFGDCKDKALLLVTLLRQSGIEASPALVSTSLRGSVSERLPAPGDFNHVIVQVTNGPQTHWLDATRSSQQGPLRQIYVGDYRCALVLRPGAKALSTYAPPPDSLPRKEVTENYLIPAPNGTGELDVITEFHGVSAEKTRSLFLESGREKIEKEYLQYYARRFPRIRVRQPLVYEEMPNENGCRTKEFYSVPHIWTLGDEDSYQLGLYPGEVDNAMGSPASSQRGDPLALNHPVNVTQKINARMFDDWLVNTKDHVENNAFYRFVEKATVQGARLHFTYSYQTFVDRVPIADLPAYNTTLFKLKDTLGYRLTYRPPGALWGKDNWLAQFNWPVVALFGCFVTVAIVVSALYLYKSELPVPLPPPPLIVPSLEGIGGWLTLVALHHIVRPIAFIYVLITLFPTVFHAEGWRLLTQPGHPEFHPYWAPVLLFELLYNSLCLIFSILLLILFFMKRAAWPRCYIALFIALFLGVCLDTFLTHQIPAARGAMAANIRAVVQIIITGAIWIPYCLVSKRVKATFRY
jgi:transglutaminase-like putative cysteine protease